MDFKLAYEYTKDLTILYVEDNEFLRMSTQKVFDNFFKQVDIAIDGDDGVETYIDYHQKSGCYYDLVISDINMPLMDGIEMSKKILTHNASQHIIFITAHNETNYLLEAIGLGVSGFLVKPLELDKLANILYKVGQAISDRRIVQQHYDQIEEMAMQMQSQNEELQKKNEELEKSLRLLDTMVYKDKHIEQPEENLTNELEDIDMIYEQVEYLINDDLPEIQELHMEIDSLVIDIISKGSDEELISDNLSQIAKHFSRFSDILQYYSFYSELADTMFKFSECIQSVPLPEEDEKKVNIFLFFESFIYVLGKWQNDLSSCSKDEINYLDASLISDMKTIMNMWKLEEEIRESEVEIF